MGSLGPRQRRREMGEVEKSDEELAREILARRPDVDIALVERAVAALRQEGFEPTPERIERVVAAMMADILEKIDSLLGEVFTDEELAKIVEEEFKRHMDPETKAANLAEVDAAIDARLHALVRLIYPKWVPREER
jgi:UDP:flavonoid glycosyltransferase YjiC (YdhE family)